MAAISSRLNWRMGPPGTLESRIPITSPTRASSTHVESGSLAEVQWLPRLRLVGPGRPGRALQSREGRSLTHALPDSHGSGQVSDVVWAGVRAETRGILAGWGAEQAAVFAVELRGAVVADEMSDAGDVAGAGG
jgi:hypothetical protein